MFTQVFTRERVSLTYSFGKYWIKKRDSRKFPPIPPQVVRLSVWRLSSIQREGHPNIPLYLSNALQNLVKYNIKRKLVFNLSSTSVVKKFNGWFPHSFFKVDPAQLIHIVQWLISSIAEPVETQEHGVQLSYFLYHVFLWLQINFFEEINKHESLLLHSQDNPY